MQTIARPHYNCGGPETSWRSFPIGTNILLPTHKMVFFDQVAQAFAWLSSNNPHSIRALFHYNHSMTSDIPLSHAPGTHIAMKQSTELHHQQAACTWVGVPKMTLCQPPHASVSPFELQFCLYGIWWVCLSVGLQNPLVHYKTQQRIDRKWIVQQSPLFLRQTHIYVHVEKWQDTQNYKKQVTPNVSNTSYTHTTYHCLKIT